MQYFGRNPPKTSLKKREIKKKSMICISSLRLKLLLLDNRGRCMTMQYFSPLLSRMNRLIFERLGELGVKEKKKERVGGNYIKKKKKIFAPSLKLGRRELKIMWEVQTKRACLFTFFFFHLVAVFSKWIKIWSLVFGYWHFSVSNLSPRLE